MNLRDRIVAHPRYKWYVLGVLTAVFTSSHVDRQIMGILLEPIKLELGASDTQMGFLIGLTFAIFYATLGMPITMLADRKNRHNIIVIATTIWSVMTALCGMAQTFFFSSRSPGSGLERAKRVLRRRHIRSLQTCLNPPYGARQWACSH